MIFKRRPTPVAGTDAKTVVLVGHCLPDRFMLKGSVARFVPGVAIEVANDEKTLAAHLHGDCVLLVNRVLDGRFETGCGIELIARVVRGDDPPVAILVSNFEDAQAEAVAAGARPGFGKRDLYAETTGAMLREAAAR